MLSEERTRGYFKYSTAAARPHLGDQPAYCEVLSGGCCAYRRALFDVMEFDAGNIYFGYAGDVEISMHIIKAGYKIYYEPEANSNHYLSPRSRISRRAGSKM